MLKKKNLQDSKIMRKLYHSVSCFYLLKLTFSISFTFSLSYQNYQLSACKILFNDIVNLDFYMLLTDLSFPSFLP